MNDQIIKPPGIQVEDSTVDKGRALVLDFGSSMTVTKSADDRTATIDVESDWVDNDLDKMQFARQGNTSSNTYLLTLNNITSNDSPDVFAYNAYLRAISLSNRNNADPFTVKIWQANSDYSVRTIIYTKVFSIANGNFNGRTGIQIMDPQISVDAGYGIYVQITNVGNPKPGDLNLIIWTRKR